MVLDIFHIYSLMITRTHATSTERNLSSFIRNIILNGLSSKITFDGSCYFSKRWDTSFRWSKICSTWGSYDDQSDYSFRFFSTLHSLLSLCEEAKQWNQTLFIFHFLFSIASSVQVLRFQGWRSTMVPTLIELSIGDI